MPSTVELNQIMFKAKIKIKKSRYVEMEIECEGSIGFLIDFLSDFTEKFSISENNKG